ncbi:uncharacterized protein MONBRDRAFT_35219 [Monosiga brevicollis MX1]|uniref:Uncharacterized protein n=1 Tax=Monosiga brevicollis TaxID=81824 RepID=A9V4P7_MONBE|nr:uncharacterized protein MONBRDRAFT_35219 [Monosiga brevicollis MX1]EDQ87492.1 predicted protein [Monosiga brevicollis MX1]|eukprot:XP_001747752.1 hypothetical protein [Monosiga brevicollis MX1]
MAEGSRNIIATGAKACTHEVALPQGYNYIPLKDTPLPKQMAKEYPFTLDPFQREAIRCIERSESVLVSAHTSAGKTVVAEYAIALSLREGQRVIYTSPIKALSNQKYRELAEEFGDVGLMTGDTTINPTASCLVMTTEILRSMLYRGSEIMREVGWLSLMRFTTCVTRSAVPSFSYLTTSTTSSSPPPFPTPFNLRSGSPCHVVYTNYRPTPLQHYLYPQGGDGLHLVVDETGAFREDSFMKAMMSLSEGGAANKQRSKHQKGKSPMRSMVRMIMKRGYQPCIVFSFSKRDCETYAMQCSLEDFTTSEEKQQIEMIFKNAIDILSEDDKQLPQVSQVLPLLLKGIGIHHGGLLPLIKEVIEILFGEGLLKVLFATETFAMGLNMPARTVVFTNARKYDGTEHRWLTSGEYIQMSGRAGRRGLDDRGIVILMMDEKVEPTFAKQMLQGQADQLNSAFHLTYNMVLNLLRVEEVNPEYMLQRSFRQFQNSQAIPGLEAKIAERQRQHDEIVIEDEAKVEEYYNIRKQLESFGEELRTLITEPQTIVPFLQPGRVVEVRDGEQNFGWGIVVDFKERAVKSKRNGKNQAEEKQIVVTTLLHVASDAGNKKPRPISTPTDKGEYKVTPVLLPVLSQISKVRLFLPKDLSGADKRRAAFNALQEAIRRFPEGLPLLDPIEDMKISTDYARGLVGKIQTLETRLFAHALHESEKRDDMMALFVTKVRLRELVSSLKKDLKQSHSIQQLDELKNMKRVLRRLQFTTNDDVIELKGRVACEVSTGDELLLTELMFNGIFNELSMAHSVALLSIFILGTANSKEKEKEKSPVEKDLTNTLNQVQENARRIARVSIDTKLDVDMQSYAEQFPVEMLEVVHDWAQGRKFSEICEKTDMFEGSIIRAMRRLEELLKQMIAAAKAIGNTELENKFAEGVTAIRRDIVFAPSLYL